MTIKTVVCVFSFAIIGLIPAMADTLKCTHAMSVDADKVASGAESWSALYTSYSKFSACDDGSVAEGFSASTEKLLIQDWKNIKEVWRDPNANASFGDFVIKHIDSTWSLDDLNTIDENAQSQCPENMSDVCKKIHESVQRAKQG